MEPIVWLLPAGILIFVVVFFYKKYHDKNRNDSTAQKNKNFLESQKIEISKRELETVFDANNEMICIIDRDCRIVRVNKGYAEFLKVPIKDLLGKNCYATFWNREQSCQDCPSQETFSKGESITKKQMTRIIGDVVNYFEIRTYPVFDDQNNIVHVIEFIRDITDEKRVTEQLIRSEKLASVGVMTAGIAHEMNNPLSGISGNAVNLLEMPEKYGLNEKGISRVSVILESSARATAIMKDLLYLSRKNNATSIMVDINKLIVKTINAVHMSGINDIHKVYKFEESIPLVQCDPSKIEQVILNIVSNAVQSIIDRKHHASDTDIDFKAKLEIATQLQNESVVISITDNGTGIPEENRSKIFDPFFSTRPTGQGTGLGLSISHRIIEEHRGRIYFECVDGLTIFSIVLPVQKKSNMYHKYD